MRKFFYCDCRQLVSKDDLSEENSSVGREAALRDFLGFFYHLAPINEK